MLQIYLATEQENDDMWQATKATSASAVHETRDEIQKEVGGAIKCSLLAFETLHQLRTQIELKREKLHRDLIFLFFVNIL